MGLFGTIGNFLSGGNQGRAADAAQESVDALRSLQTPDTADMELNLETYVQQGLITPEEAEVYLQQQSGMAGISTDPALQAAQQDALASLQDIGRNGMTAMDRAKLGEIQSQEQTQARGAREAIMQSAQQRGAGGSGMELLQQMQNQQDSATRQSSRDTDVAGMAQQRALDALQAGGAMAGRMQGQSFDQQARQADAQDVINHFNTTNEQSGANRSVDARNAAQRDNLTARQSINNAGVDTRNAQQMNNKKLPQQAFENNYKRAGGTSNALTNQAGQYNRTGDQITHMVGTGIEAGAKVAAAAASDERVKEDIKPFNASEFLDSLTPSKYNYKNPKKHGTGPQVGVMAQDVEKEAPQMVSEDQDGTKIVDFNKSGGPLFASLADIHDRLKKVEGK